MKRLSKSRLPNSIDVFMMLLKLHVVFIPWGSHHLLACAPVEHCCLCLLQHGCGNFVRVVQSFNRTHLYVCGSGAFSPVCVYVNRGRRSEVTLVILSALSMGHPARVMGKLKVFKMQESMLPVGFPPMLNSRRAEVCGFLT